jgi:hypothetical protein
MNHSHIDVKVDAIRKQEPAIMINEPMDMQGLRP